MRKYLILLVFCFTVFPVIHSQLTLQDSLVAWYPFNGNADDESGNGHHGVANNALPSEDRFGVSNAAYYFDGNEDYIDISTFDICDSELTISCWIHPIDHTNQYYIIFSKQYTISPGNEDGDLQLDLDLTGVSGYSPIVRISKYDGGWTSTETNSIVEFDKWTHLVWVWDKNKGSAQIYIDGKEASYHKQSSWTTEWPDNNNPLRIGTRTGPPSSYEFAGKIDDIRVYNRILTENEIFVLYHEGGWEPFDSIIDPRDGQVYNTVIIGDQIWMAENLRAVKYSDGTPLVDGTGAGDISGDYNSKYYFWYDDDSVTYAQTYGALYTWAAVMNGAASSDDNPSGVQGICPDGWHVPSDSEWKELEIFLGMSQAEADLSGWRGSNEGDKLKESGTIHWNNPNTGATNSSGYTALPAGRRTNNGFDMMGSHTLFWLSSDLSSSQGWRRDLDYSSSQVYREDSDKYFSFSVRCVKDSGFVQLNDTLQIHILNIDKITCHGDSNGSAAVFITGGTPPYTILWNDQGGTTSEIVHSLVPDRWYKVKVTDALMNSAIDSIILTEPAPIVLNKDYLNKLCPGEEGYVSLNPSGGIPPYFYEWSTGSTTDSIGSLDPGEYTVIVTDANGCIAADTSRIDSLKTYQGSEICMVTINSFNQIMVVWEKTYNKGIASYKIYRRQPGDIYSEVGEVLFDSLSIFIDESPNPTEQSYKYRIAAMDSCGNVSELSEYHKTVHMWTAVGVNDEVTLNWNDYEGYEYFDFEIYRGTDFMQLWPVRTIPSDSHSWTDPNVPAGRVYYKVAAIKSTPCYPSSLKSDLVFESAMSNLGDNGVPPGVQYNLSGKISIFPNPFDRIATVEFNNPDNQLKSISIISLSGKIVKQYHHLSESQIEISRDNLPDGMYILEIRGDRISRCKIVIQ
jgi:uncharacterized protein (TIGR02145 family)